MPWLRWSVELRWTGARQIHILFALNDADGMYVDETIVTHGKLLLLMQQMSISPSVSMLNSVRSEKNVPYPPQVLASAFLTSLPWRFESICGHRMWHALLRRLQVGRRWSDLGPRLDHKGNKSREKALGDIVDCYYHCRGTILRGGLQFGEAASLVAKIVFIIDNDETERESTLMLPEFYGFDVRSHVSAEDFIGQPRVEADCLLVDYLITGMTGLDLLEYLRAGDDQAPALMVTGCWDSNIAARAARIGIKLFQNLWWTSISFFGSKMFAVLALSCLRW